MIKISTLKFKGQIWSFQAFEVGYGINLQKCLVTLKQASPKGAPKSKRAPINFGLDHQPVVWEQEGGTVVLGKQPITFRKSVTLYDFGVISCAISFDFVGTLEAWRDIAIHVHESKVVQELIRETLAQVLSVVSTAIEDHRVSHLEENYIVFQMNPEKNVLPHEVLQKEGQMLAQIIRGESIPLSPEERDEALRRQVSYTYDDLAMIDWAAALILDESAQDTISVLEIANAELLEMRYLDHRLDLLLEESYRRIKSNAISWREFLRPYGKGFKKLAETMADAAAEFETVNNAIKLTNDQYLARVYRLAGERFHLKAFEADISRKIESLWNIHNVFIDRAMNRRVEALEWIIIILIAVELFPFSLFFK